MRIAAALVFTFLPGAWITFGLRLPGFSSASRLLTGLVLAPVVLPAQLYLLRALGAPFETAVALLVAVNLPAAWLAARRFERRGPSRAGIAQGALLLLLCAASLGPQLSDVQARAYTGHAWMFADAAYFVANGDLDLEEAELAGVRLAYPWAGLVFQSVVSFLAGASPVTAYVWVNFVWLVAAGGLAAAVVGELGGGRLAKAAGVVLLFFGVNFPGYLLLEALRAARGEVDIRYLFALFGDGRFTPWLAKFLFLQQEPFGLGLFLATLLVLVRRWRDGLTGSPLALLASLLGALSIVYPILFPAGLAVAAAALLGALAESRRREALLVSAVLVLSSVVGAAHLLFVSRDRVDAMVRLSDGWWVGAKAVSAPIVLAVLIAASVPFLRDAFRLHRRAATVLVGGLIGSFVLYAVLWLGEWRNEYKFVFTAAASIFPLAALGFERTTRRFGRGAWAVLVLAAFVLAIPLLRKFSQGWPLEGRGGPPVDGGGFDLRLESSERFAALTDLIRARTPVDSILVLGEDTGLHIPTLTRRKLFVPPLQEKAHPGVGETADDMFRFIKGYDSNLLAERRAAVGALFGPDDDPRPAALFLMRALGRPVVVVLRDGRDGAVARWLAARGGGRLLGRAEGYSVWLLGPGAPSA